MEAQQENASFEEVENGFDGTDNAVGGETVEDHDNSEEEEEEGHDWGGDDDDDDEWDDVIDLPTQ
jgi:hypothetical protein